MHLVRLVCNSILGESERFQNDPNPQNGTLAAETMKTRNEETATGMGSAELKGSSTHLFLSMNSRVSIRLVMRLCKQRTGKGSPEPDQCERTQAGQAVGIEVKILEVSSHPSHPPPEPKRARIIWRARSNTQLTLTI